MAADDLTAARRLLRAQVADLATGVGLGDDQEPGARPAGGQGGRQHAVDRANVAAEAELANGPQALERGRRHRPGRGQQPDRDGRANVRISRTY